MKTIYFDCFSGISGDMCLGALLDAGLSLDRLERELSRLDLSGYRLNVRQVRVQGLAATDVTVEVEAKQPARHLQDILGLLEQSSLQPAVVAQSRAVFCKLAEAEAAVHGVPVEHVHFHEVGAMDAILDVVGTIAGLSMLDIVHVYSSPLPLTSGWVQTEHGLLPLPAPATARLLGGIPVYGSPLQAELVTPTGAAILATLAKGFGPIPDITLQQVGYGAGKRVLPHPNLLRVFIGDLRHQIADDLEVDTVSILETQIDDMNPELFGVLWEELPLNGALDVMMLPGQMKKGRPGTLVTVLCRPADKASVARCLLRETTTTGVRFREEQRFKCSRQVMPVDTPWGPVRVKFSSFTDTDGRRHHQAAPEYEDCRQVARSASLPVKTVYDAAKACAGIQMESDCQT